MPRAVTPSPLTPRTPPAGLEPGSFRDPESRVFYAGDEVYRALSADGLSDFEALRGDRPARRRARRRAPSSPRTRPRCGACSSTSRPGCCATSASRSSPTPTSGRSRCSRTPRSLQLDLLLAVARARPGAEGLDALQRPVQGRAAGVRRHRLLRAPARGRALGRLPPVLHALPLPAAAAVGEGRALPALAARLDRRHHADRRCAACMSFRDRFRRACSPTSSCTRGSRRATPTGPDQVKQEVKRVFKKELFVANVRKMRKLVERLEWDPPEGVWTAYGERNSYTDDDARRKDDFVREVATLARLERSSGTSARTTAATRASPPRAPRRWSRSTPTRARSSCSTATCATRATSRSSRSTMNLADPSPGLGWRGLERKSLPDRGKPDLVLALALVHHVAISANVPVKEFVDWLASLGSRARDRVPHARGPDGQEAARAQARRPASRLRARLLRAHASARRSRSSAPSASESGTRVLYFARPKRG